MAEKRDIENLFRTHFERLFSLATAILHDEEQARDIVQDVFAAMIYSDTVPNTPAYLFTAVKNRCISLLRNTTLHSRIENEYLPEIELYDNEEIFSEDILSQINAIICTLPPQCRQVIDLRFNQGLKFAEIASQMGISRNMVFRHLRHALDIIRKNIDYGQI